MGYQVLARKWRPGSFGEMVGQEHVLQALINALNQDRLHHAYLFTGTRGVGKTTVARILAKCLNCEAGVSAKPCGTCGACREISEGRFVDLIEVDAASRTKVEDTRELLENVQYAPTRGRYKVYLIDEVHMLSTHSFNALLKTLEEPPPHVKFLLATTNPQKLPATILSRCLQFHLKRLPPQLITQYLEQILESENIQSEAGALRQLSRAADGSMRDALSLLDQSIAHGGGEIRESEVRSMLGVIEQQHAFDLLYGLAAGDATAVLQKIATLAEQISDFATVLEDLLSLLQRVAIAQVLQKSGDDGLGDWGKVLQLADQISSEDLQLYYQIGLVGRRDLPYAPDPRGGFEMVLLRMLAFRPAEVAPVTARRTAPAAKPVESAAKPVETRAAPAGQPPVAKSKNGRQQVTAAATGPAVEAQQWADILETLPLKGMARELAANCVFAGKNGDTVKLSLDPTHAHLQRKNQERRLQEVLAEYYQAPIKLVIASDGLDADTPAQKNVRLQQERQQEAVQSIEADGNVKAMQEMFDAKLQPDSIEPLNK